MALTVVLGWMSVGVWEGLGMQGRGPEGGDGELRWYESVGGRWVGVSLRLLVTMGKSVSRAIFAELIFGRCSEMKSAYIK